MSDDYVAIGGRVFKVGNGRKPAKGRKARQISRRLLRPGMVVATPKHYFDGGKKRPFSEIWPNAPASLVVELWDWEGGESSLVAQDGSGSVDLNVLDYPKTFTLISG